MRKFLAALIVIALAAGGYYAVKTWRGGAAGKEEYVTATITRGDIENNVLASGTLEAVEQIDVGAQVSGQVKNLLVDLGDTVKKDQLIAEIDSVPQQNAVKNSAAALENMKAQLSAKQAALEEKQLNFSRLQRLIDVDAISRSDYDTANAALRTAKADIAALNAQIKQAQISADTASVNLGYTKITSPIDGVVVAIVTKQGQTVNANQSAPTIVRVANLNTMTIKAQIAEADVPKVKPGQEVYFTILGEPEKRRYAKLRAIEPAPDTTTSTTDAIYYNGLFDVDNEDGQLRIAMTAEVTIVLASAKDVLMIPAAALGKKNKDGTYDVDVMLDKGKKETRKVTVGLNNKVNAEVKEGLAKGDRVILGGSSGASSNLPRRMRGPMGF